MLAALTGFLKPTLPGDHRERSAIDRRRRVLTLHNQWHEHANHRCLGDREFGLQRGLPATLCYGLGILGKLRIVRSKNDKLDRS